MVQNFNYDIDLVLHYFKICDQTDVCSIRVYTVVKFCT